MRILPQIAAFAALGVAAMAGGTAAADHRDRDGVSLSVNLAGGERHYDRDGRYDRREGYRDYRHRDRGRVVRYETFDTRYRANIVLVEEVTYGRRGRDLVCTVSARGPEADYVRDRRLDRIARRYCSPYARVVVYS